MSPRNQFVSFHSMTRETGAASIMFSTRTLVALAVASSPLALAATLISDVTMTDYLNAGGLELAYANSPVWFFGQALNQPPCIPNWAYQGTPSTPDTYDAAHRTLPAARCEYPNVGCNCRKPGVAVGNPSPVFPVYYTYKQCNSGDIRVSLNLFYEKDGAYVFGLDTGHEFDWERVIILYNKDVNYSWFPAQLILGQHSGYQKVNWADVQNTLTTTQASSLDPRQTREYTTKHPKVYIAWDKHPAYHTRNTGFYDPISQSTSNAFRSQHWWYFVDKSYYIRADGLTLAGMTMRSQDWGSATSIPPLVNDGICSV